MFSGRGGGAGAVTPASLYKNSLPKVCGYGKNAYICRVIEPKQSNMNPLPFLLEDAATYAASMVQSLRDSHTEAINNGNEFAAVAIFLALTKAVEMEAATAGLRDAAKNSKA